VSIQARSQFVFKHGKWIPVNFHEVWMVCDTCGEGGDYHSDTDLNRAVHLASVWAQKNLWQCITDQTFCTRCRLSPAGVGVRRGA